MPWLHYDGACHEPWRPMMQKAAIAIIPPSTNLHQLINDGITFSAVRYILSHARNITPLSFTTGIFKVIFMATPWWRYQMDTFSALLALCAGNSPVTGEFPHKGKWRGALMFSFICVWVNGWINNSEAGVLRRHPAHYDVIVMPHCNDSHGGDLECVILYVWPQYSPRSRFVPT